MKVIAIMGQKGGIGKTTTATSLAYVLAEHNHQNVLLIDADQQGNASQIMGVYDPEGLGLPQLLTATNGEETVETVATPSHYGHFLYGMDVIPANGYLADANVEIVTDQDHDQVHRLRDALEQAADRYDVAIIDCGLVLDMSVLNAIVAADLWIIPVKPGGFEADALDRMLEQLPELRQLNSGLEVRALPVMVGSSKAHQQAVEWIRTQSGAPCFNTTIRRGLIGEKYTAARVPLPVYRPRCGLTEDYIKLGYEIVAWMYGEENTQ